jgi:hypothetical protein
VEYEFGLKVYYESYVDVLLLDLCTVRMWAVLPRALRTEAACTSKRQQHCLHPHSANARAESTSTMNNCESLQSVIETPCKFWTM